MEEFSRVFPEWMEAGSEHLHRRADGAARGAEHNLERSVWGSVAKPTLQGQPDPAPGLFQAFRVSPGYWVVSQQCRRWGGPGSPGFGDDNSPAALAAVDPDIPGENRPWKGWDGRQELPSSQFPGPCSEIGFNVENVPAGAGAGEDSPGKAPFDLWI